MNPAIRLSVSHSGDRPVAALPWSRRRWLGAALASSMAPIAMARTDAPKTAGAVLAPPPGAPGQAPHFPFGAVRPARPVPAMKVRTHLGQATDLGSLLNGRVTAVQLMFTGCSAICPIQGALFAQLQQALRSRGVAVNLLSLSIDPLGDSPAALAAWLGKFSAGPGWLAAAPEVADVERLSRLLGSGGEDPRQSADVHSGQVFVIDRRGAMTYRTATMPAVGPFVDVLAQLVKDA